MLSFLQKFTLVSNSALPFRKVLVSEFLLGISETLCCSAHAPHVKIVPLLDVHQLLMLFVGTLMYSQSRTLFSHRMASSLAILYTGILIMITCTNLNSASSGFCRSLFFDPEDRGDVPSQLSGSHQTTRSYNPEVHNFHRYRRDYVMSK
jgi:hypothetical protein